MEDKSFNSTPPSAILSPDSPIEEPTKKPSKKPNKKILLFGGIGLGVILIGLIIFLVVPKGSVPEPVPEESTGLSPDGLTEAEIAELGFPTDENNKIITEYNLFDDSAFSIIVKDDFFSHLSADSDRNEITDDYVKETIYNFFSKVYPDYASLTFLPNSLEENSFKMRSNTGVEYTVKLDFASADDEVPTISVLSAEGNEIFKYDGQYYRGDTIILTDEEAEAFFGDAEPAGEDD